MGYPLPQSRLGWSTPHLDLRWGTPSPDLGRGTLLCQCGQTENITFPHPSDVGSNDLYVVRLEHLFHGHEAVQVTGPISITEKGYGLYQLKYMWQTLYSPQRMRDHRILCLLSLDKQRVANWPSVKGPWTVGSTVIHVTEKGPMANGHEGSIKAVAHRGALLSIWI